MEFWRLQPLMAGRLNRCGSGVFTLAVGHAQLTVLALIRRM